MKQIIELTISNTQKTTSYVQSAALTPFVLPQDLSHPKVNKPQNVMLCEKRQLQKSTYYIIPFIEMSRVGKFIETENRRVVAGVGTS